MLIKECCCVQKSASSALYKVFIHMPLEIFVVEQQTLYLLKREHCTICIHDLCHNHNDFAAMLCKAKFICVIDLSTRSGRQNVLFQKILT